MASFTISQAIIPTPEGYGTVDVQIQGDRIHAIAPHLEPLGTLVRGDHKLLLPGFINAHTHSSEMWQRGLMVPGPLELWIADLYESTPLSPEQIYLSALGTAVETLQTGGTSVVDHLVLIPGQELETVAAAVRAYQEIGIRAFIGPLIQDESLPASLPQGATPRPTEPYLRSTAATLDLMETVVERYHRPDQGISILVAPTGIQLCSDALLTGCRDLGDRHGLARHTHLLETLAQKQLAQEKYGCTAVEHLHRLGFLGPQTSLAHSIWLDPPDLDLLAQTQSTVVHNPLSNLRLGSGIAPVLRYRQGGVNVAFGCDGAASNDGQDLLEALKIGTLLHNLTEPDYRHWLTPHQTITMASQGGAQGLGRGQDLGRLAVGYQADLVLYDLMNLSLLPRTDPVGLLVLGRPVQAVDSLWVKGDRLIAQGQIQTLDVAALRQALFAGSQWQRAQVSPSRRDQEPHYRQVMALPAIAPHP